MRLIFTFLALTFATGASAQTLPGPEDYDAAVVAALADHYPYCTAAPGSTAANMSVFLEIMITFDFPDARDLDRETRLADAEAAVERSIADGAVIADAEGIRLPVCTVTERQITLRLEHRTRNFLYYFTNEEGVALLSSSMQAYGCSVARGDEPAFLTFAIRHVADLYEIPLPDPLPEGEDPLLTPFAEELLFILDIAGSDMRRAGLMIVEDGIARLEGCVPTGDSPPPIEAVQDNSHEAIAIRIEAMDDAAVLDLFLATYNDIGCSMPVGPNVPYSLYFTQRSVEAVGGTVEPEELIEAYGNIFRSDAPYQGVLRAASQNIVDAMIAALDTGVLLDADDMFTLIGDCTPSLDPNLLDRFELP